MRYIFTSLLAGFVLCCATAQETVNPNNESCILDENIHTVQLYVGGSQMTLPIVDLKAAGGQLTLTFDHLGTDLKDYIYTLTHCNSDWQPSELLDNEYIYGFAEDRILEVASSVNTLTNYTQYTLKLPNANMKWTVSGNFLLKIFDNDDDRRLVLVRRFSVVEPLWKADIQWQTNTASVGKSNTHQELDFIITHRGMRVPNPQNDVKAFVLQNGRWDNAIGPIKPLAARNDQLVFDYQDKIVFPAGKEWRFFDMRSYESRGEWVKTIAEMDDFYVVTLRTDEERKGNTYAYTTDLNGRFYIQNRHLNQTLLQADYAKVFFSISRKLPEEDADVYVFGELSDWQLKPEFRMEYDETIKAYICTPFLKQGFYNYAYVTVNRDTKKPSEDGFEGNWYETGNQYTTMVYFRTFGDRYDRLMCAVSMETIRR
jgi:hypothetical protein